MNEQKRLIGHLRALLSQLHGGEVEVVETHLSWVLLAGDYAYKIKKAIRFAFADFSTLSLRERNCRDELTLNRRFSPQLYLDLVAIGGSVDQPTLDDGTPAIEYAVKLQRFSNSDELSSLAAARSIAVQDLWTFGERLAAIHESLPACEETDAQQAQRTALENVAEMIRFAPALRASIEPWSRWMTQEWRAIDALASRRRTEGKIRECHGDLHIRNVVRLEGLLTAFDCIEFNRTLRCIDVASDVAFLTMDLQANERTDLAYAFLSGWCERSGDYAAIAMLRFFTVHRALVRAKVAVLERNIESRDRYLALAQRTKMAATPLLIITCGLSGSGKTWLSERLVPMLPALRIRSDVERKRLAGLHAQQSSRSLGWDLYSLEINRRVYDALATAAETVLRAGQTVIVDAAFLKRAERHAFSELAARCGAGFAIVDCVASQESLRDRLRHRQAQGSDASEADEHVMLRQQQYWEAFDERERDAVLEADTNNPQSVTSVSEALQAVGSRGDVPNSDD